MFEHIQVKKELRKFVIFVHFNLRNATYLNISFRLPSCVVRTDNVKEKESRDGKFHLLLVTHKFPATRYLQDDPVIMSESSLFAEAILLPWGLDLSGEGAKGMLETRSEYGHGQDSEEVWSKRPKMVHTFSTSTNLKDTSVENQKKTSNISCLVNFQSINDHKFLRPANLFSAGSSSRRIFLEFLSKSFYNYELLRPGWYFMMKFSEDTKNQLAFGTHEKILLTFQTCFWSVSFSSFECLQQKAPPTDHSSETSVAAADGVPPNEPPRKLSMNQMPKDTDVHLYLSVEAMELLQGYSEYGTPPVQGEVLSVSACFERMMNTPLQHCESFDPSCSLPVGNLTSIFGDVIDVHHLPCSSADETSAITHESMSNIGTLAACNDSLKYICIHVFDGFHMVKIHGLISKHAYPIGLGPGTSATFHRVLIPLSSKGKLGLVLTPVSFIEVDFVKEVYRPSHCSSFWPSSSLNMVEEDTMNTVTSILISQLIPYLDNKPFRLRCWVVEIHILVLEKAKCLLKGLFKTSDVKIPIAGFILDDGSASCCCWADADRAEKLLRLHEIVIRTSPGRLTGRKSTPHRTQDTISYPLKKMLKKHHRITIKNNGSMEDSSCLNLSSSGHSNQVLTISEETLLKHVILNACAGPVINVVGNVMDANSLSQVERELTEMQVGMLPIANIWATEVVCTDLLSEARYLLSELSPE
ncbi:CST complex subunit CTC1 [Acorus calamus]|uniref:CST complex subunit CTC1 n=1 Tax=Acorus calamus TaxID=4465 RepID=A0AAV9EX40_ACOCL|nr:CST complex subunit CTC1 [Acorus calamus]